MSYVITICAVAAFIFAFLFISAKFNKTGGRPAKWLALFFISLAPMVACFIILASQTKPDGGLYEYFINGLKVGEQYVSSGQMRQSNILSMILLSGPVAGGVIMVLATLLALIVKPFRDLGAMPKLRPVNRGYVVWSALCMGPYFLGLIPLYKTLRAARSDEFAAAAYYKSSKKWLVILTAATVMLLFILAAAILSIRK